MPINPQFQNPQFQADAVDLGKAAEKREQERTDAENRALAHAEIVAARWDRKMSRVFKGIMPRATRHRLLLRSAENPKEQS